jgi:hypothetical protein
MTRRDLSIPPTRTALAPTVAFYQCDQALDGFVEQRRLFQIKHMAILPAIISGWCEATKLMINFALSIRP